MKKKIYEMPKVTVTAIEAESFCAGSGGIETKISTEEIGATEMLSKKHRGTDLWGDDYDE